MHIEDIINKRIKNLKSSIEEIDNGNLDQIYKETNQNKDEMRKMFTNHIFILEDILEEANKKCVSSESIGSVLLKNVLNNERPISFTGVATKDIKRIFAEFGIEEK